MNRIIKFRAWDADAKGVWEWGQLQKVEQWWMRDGLELQQFTGLFDKNGKEIFEGDILDVKEDTGMQNGTFMNYLHEVAWDERGGWNLISPWNESEVIGNIYENPELLAQKTN